MTSARQIAARTLAVDGVTLRVLAALREQGLDPILLKGPSFAAWLYAASTPRAYTDTDLLIPPAWEARATSILSDLGFTNVADMPGPVPHSKTWRNTRWRAEVDLHIRLPLTDAQADTWTCLQSHTEVLRLGNTDVTVLDSPAKAFHVVIHALQNSLSSDRTNADLLRALSTAPDPVWLEAADIARQLGGSDAFAVGLSGLPEGRALAARLGIWPSDRVPLTVRLLARGSAGSGAPALDHLSYLSSWRQRWAFILTKVFPPQQYVRAIQVNGRSCHWLTSYVRYWFRLATKAPRAIQSWRSARR